MYRSYQGVTRSLYVRFYHKICSESNFLISKFYKPGVQFPYQQCVPVSNFLTSSNFLVDDLISLMFGVQFPCLSKNPKKRKQRNYADRSHRPYKLDSSGITSSVFLSVTGKKCQRRVALYSLLPTYTKYDSIPNSNFVTAQIQKPQEHQ